MTDVVDRYFNACNAHDLDAVMRCYCSKPVAVGPGGPMEGRSEVASYHTGIWQAFPDLHATVMQKVSEGETTAVAAVGTGRHTGSFPVIAGEVLPATGRYVSVRCCWFFSTAGGLIVHQQVFYDQFEMYLQLGLSPVRLGTCPRGT